MKITIENLSEYFETLDNIRDSGITNMWGASPYLQEFHRPLQRKLADKILIEWMNTFNFEETPEERATKAIGSFND